MVACQNPKRIASDTTTRRNRNPTDSGLKCRTYPENPRSAMTQEPPRLSPRKRGHLRRLPAANIWGMCMRSREHLQFTVSRESSTKHKRNTKKEKDNVL